MSKYQHKNNYTADNSYLAIKLMNTKNKMLTITCTTNFTHSISLFPTSAFFYVHPCTPYIDFSKIFALRNQLSQPNC